jgi:serine/threonine-protein kinase
MNDRSDPNDTTDLTACSLEEQIRRRFQKALERSRSDEKGPDPAQYAAEVPEPARSRLRKELESIRSGLPPTVPDGNDGDTRAEPPALNAATADWMPGSLPGVSQSTTTDQVPGSVAPESAASPNQETVKPPAGKTLGTTEYAPAGGPDRSSSLSAKPKDRRDISVPQSVAGYEILGVLGRGAMGVVYKARQPGLKRVVALKMILAGDHAGKRELARFRTEAEAAARLHHPNIVQIYEVGEDNGLPYFSLEYVDGVSLSSRIDNAPQPPREAARIVQILALGMETAHQRGIIHRDLKPANVLVSADGTPKITDFGLAKRLEEDSGQTRSGTVLGTPSYMAPEQAEGRTEDVGPLSDVYSLGAILYEMLTGRAPFKAGSLLDTLQQVKTQEPVAPIQFAPSVPRDLETICLKCLQKDPGRRYASAAALADDLGRFLDGRPIVARPVSLPERFRRWTKRNPRVALLSSGVLLLIVAWAATSSVLAVSIKREKDKTEVARKQADANAEQAEKNAETAKSNAARAEKNAETAKSRHQIAVSRMVKLGEDIQRRLSPRRLGPTAPPELRGIREEMLVMLRDSLVQMAKDIEGTGVTEYGMANACQNLGDLLRKLGQGEEAVRQYLQGYEIMNKFAAEKPDSDLPLGNKALFARRLGDMAMDLIGDVSAARAHYQGAYDLQKEIIAGPRGREYNEADKNRLLWEALFGLGKISLSGGDLAEARRNFEEARTTSLLWRQAVADGNSSGADSSLAGDHLYLGVVADLTGNAAEAKSNIDECLRLCHDLEKVYPKFLEYKMDLAESYGLQGDVLLRAGQVEAAAESYKELRKYVAIVINADRENISWLPNVARTHERVAALSLRQNDSKEAARRYQEALKIWDELVQIERNNLTWRVAHAVALAHAGKTEDARKAAGELAQRCGSAPGLLVQLARCHAILSAASVDAAEKKQAVSGSLALLRQAADRGWKDGRLIDTEPEFAPVRSEPEYKRLQEQWQNRP